MSKTIQCVLMRSGTSRGPFFLKDWLPENESARNQILCDAIGSGDPTQISGLGGGTTLTSKVAIVSKSKRPDSDVDYFFVQTGVAEKVVDTRPNCGNMLAGVGPFAIEQGLVEAKDGSTLVKVFNVNTGAKVEVTVQTPNKKVQYEGDVHIDGVPDAAAPVYLTFLDVWGAVTGSLFPTGNRVDVIDGIKVTCIDAAMAMVLIPAKSLGVTGRESAEELDKTPGLTARLNEIRLKAGVLMGLGDVSNSVMPKPVLVSDGDNQSSIVSRYFTPKRCHTSHAVTGAIGVATACVLPGTVANKNNFDVGHHMINICHPSGKIQIALDLGSNAEGLLVERASVVRTVKKIMQGFLEVPSVNIN